MDKQEIVKFLNSNPVCRLATLEGDQPRVRGMMMYRVDDAGILFHTGPKDLLRQLILNPKVEICFNNADSSRQVRVTGIAELVEDESLKQEIIEARPFLKPIIKAHGTGLLKVFRVTRCVATVWTMETNMAPKVYVEL